jgi:hypothetical protein
LGPALLAVFSPGTVYAKDPSDPAWADVGRACPIEAPAPSLSDAARDSIPFSRFLPEEDWAGVARRTPGGWGGIFLVDGQPTIYLKDPSQREVAVASLATQSSWFPLDSVVVRQGRWDFAQLNDWYRYLSPQLSAVAVTFTDIQEARNRIEYGVVDEAARAQLEEILTDLDVPCFLVAIEIRGPARPG